MSTNVRFEEGLEVRRAVLGDAYVDRALNNATSFSETFQELVTEYCWGTIWTRPAIPRQTRSLLVLSMLTVLGATHEIEAHVRGALRNGCTVDEIREVFLQATIYAGVPRGVDAMRAAQSVLIEEGVVAPAGEGADANKAKKAGGGN